MISDHNYELYHQVRYDLLLLKYKRLRERCQKLLEYKHSEYVPNNIFKQIETMLKLG